MSQNRSMGYSVWAAFSETPCFEDRVNSVLWHSVPQALCKFEQGPRL